MRSFVAVTIMLAALVSADDLYCRSVDCGLASGFFRKHELTWNLPQGDYSTEVVNNSVCLLGHVRGFKAEVCLVEAYPSMSCVNENSIFVQKNGSPNGFIDVIPYCGLL